MKDGSRRVVVGIDGVPHEMMEDLSEEGVMPNFAELMDEGDFRLMQSSVPAVSSTSWGTIFTGRNPGEHGVYGFSDMIEGTYTLSFTNFLTFKSPAFWQTDGGRSVILNVPSTYPAQEMDGCLVSGFVSPDFEKSVYPSELVGKLEEFDYRIDIDSGKGHKSDRLLFKELDDTMEARIRAYRYLWDHYDWDTFMMVFTGSDRLEHFLWDAYEDPGHERHEDFLDYFRRLDEVIGEVDGELDEDDSLVLLSDHGMERVKYNVNVNAFLEEEGYLELGDEGEKYNRIEDGTEAFALEHGRIYLNREDRYPEGSVAEGEEEEIIGRLKDDLEGLEDDGNEVVGTVWERDEIYEGSEVDGAPDLVLVPNSGYNLRGKVSKELFEESPFTGMHDPNAFLYARNSAGPVPDEPSVEDFVPVLTGGEVN